MGLHWATSSTGKSCLRTQTLPWQEVDVLLALCVGEMWGCGWIKKNTLKVHSLLDLALVHRLVTFRISSRSED